MKPIESSLFHIVREPRTPSGATHPTLILIHGRGADEEDLMGLADYFDERLLTLSVRAPYPFPYSGGFTWYEILGVGKPEPVMFMESYRKLCTFLDDVKKNYPVDPAKLFLLGFSMGAMMSYALALTKPGEIAGVMANSGYIPEETGLEYRWNDLGTLPFFVAHGTHDPVVPVSMGRRARMLLEQTQANLTYKEYPMAHQISEESLNDMSQWLNKQL